MHTIAIVTLTRAVPRDECHESVSRSQSKSQSFHDVCTRFWQFSALSEGESTISISSTDEADLSRLAKHELCRDFIPSTLAEPYNYASH